MVSSGAWITGRRRGLGRRPGLATRFTVSISLSHTSLLVCAAAKLTKAAGANNPAIIVKQKANNRIRIIFPFNRSLAGSASTQKLLKSGVIRRYGTSEPRQPTPLFLFRRLKFWSVIITDCGAHIIDFEPEMAAAHD